MHSTNTSRRDVASRQNPKSLPQSTIPAKRSAEAQEAAWVADEDRFVLQQAKRKASIRVRAGRAQPIDWLAVTLQAIDPAGNGVEDEEEGAEPEVIDPEGVFEGLDDAGLAELEKGIDTYLALEKSRNNVDYWSTMKVICKNRQASARDAPAARGITSVSSDLDRLLGSKNYEELETLEKQIRQKLRSDEPIDFDYWDQLLKNLLIYKAKAKLRKVSESVIKARLDGLRKQQEQDALISRKHIAAIVHDRADRGTEADLDLPKAADAGSLDPEPALRLSHEDKALHMIDESSFLEQLTQSRRKVLKMGFIPAPQNQTAKASQAPSATLGLSSSEQNRSSGEGRDESSQAATALYEREVARGVGDNEEVFTGEEEITTTSKPQWGGKYRPRKPRYFNRVQMGYEWNKYNQTHYDHDNPPPKVVQGYKFNIFYPDLIDRTKAPTYRIERENGRKRGQSFAPAGEEDTCLIRFVAGPPYEDIAFRIVDKEWDYSAKRERGFRSSFDKGILQLHFQFKKIYYRK